MYPKKTGQPKCPPAFSALFGGVAGQSNLPLPHVPGRQADCDLPVLIYQWKVKKIIGEEVMGGVRYYLVDWEPTLEPASHVSRDLVRVWKDQKAKMQAPGEKKSRDSGTKKATDQSRVEKRHGGSRRGEGVQFPYMEFTWLFVVSASTCCYFFGSLLDSSLHFHGGISSCT
ncbi:hypothetical protein N657DRAFT_375098 [Parathielavia appendiculata]|uniref:Chromo domain-containing protein n=1 Tax=Parathielavia appendiculata TaxID=2587402 RepID=A0AAN6YY17_9PEZI|nr:hypothetical protein N657DRAFT_375098 [Parathielavia appendiculata]